MSSTTYDWFTIDDNGDLVGDGAITVGPISENTGRTGRSADVTLTTEAGPYATISLEQDAGTESIDIHHVENSSGVTQATIPSAGGIMYLVGYSNCRYLSATETTGKTYTDMNSNSGMLHRGGFLLYEDSGTGTMHQGVPISTNITPDYGATAAYQFKIPFYCSDAGSSGVVLSFSMSNQASSVTDTFTINMDNP